MCLELGIWDEFGKLQSLLRKMYKYFDFLAAVDEIAVFQAIKVIKKEALHSSGSG